MVSSKCCQVVSPSPFRFLAALIPPCAQTECERFTGTMEKRSTWPPASAILIVAESPASPPPTTMIFGFAISSFLCHSEPLVLAVGNPYQLPQPTRSRTATRRGTENLICRRPSKQSVGIPHRQPGRFGMTTECKSTHLLAFHLSGRRRVGAHMSPCRIGRCNECPHSHHSHDHKQQPDREADSAHFASRALALCDSPFGTEEPDSIREVPRRADDRNDIKRQHPGIHQFLLNFAESGAGILKQSGSAESQVIHVLDDVGEGNDSRPALGRVHPIPLPRVSDYVRLAAIPDVDSIQSVIKNRNVDEAPFQKWNERQRVQKFDLGRVGMRTVRCIRVGDEVLDKKSPDRNDAAERMHAAQQK